MHLLAAKPGTLLDGTEAVDLAQSPGDIVVLSAADSEIACLASAQKILVERDPTRPSLRLASLLALRHNMSVDLYTEAVVSKAKLVVVRLLGGVPYWPYGVEQLAQLCRHRQIPIAFLSGDDKPDPVLQSWSSLEPETAGQLWRYLSEGGQANAEGFLRLAGTVLGRVDTPAPPAPLLHAGIYWPGAASGLSVADLARYWQPGAPVVAITFYRALVQAGNLAPVDALIAALRARGLNPLPLWAQSLKDAQAVALLTRLLAEAPPDLVLNATAFAVGAPGAERTGTVFDAADCPVIQIVFAGGGEAAWRVGTRGLDVRDLAMNVALPEVDGRIIGRAVSFKDTVRRDPLTEADLVSYRSVPDRIDFMADLARDWTRLRRTEPADRRVGFVLANYPNKDGRIGNGVGLDTPNGLIAVLQAMAGAGYAIGEIPADGDALMRALQAGPTNRDKGRGGGVVLPLDTYRAAFAALPAAVQQAVTARWGEAEADPFFVSGQGFRLPVLVLGTVAIGVQPSRGYDIDPASSYHSPDLVPPHGYFAFYAWLRQAFGAQAIVHMGKHGTMEWLPGKAVALSEACLPEAVFGPLPHLYPFIVNDPGEGSQAKRRAQAVIIDHLTPPLTRAESYGPLVRLESLVDEYYAASGLDPRRLQLLGREILDLAASSGLDRDCGIERGMPTETALTRLDAHLCDLKELQIRDGLHVFGRSPTGRQRLDLIIALARAPRGGALHQTSLIRALAEDLGLGFDPLLAPPAEPWTGPRPMVLAEVHQNPSPALREREGPAQREGEGVAEERSTALCASPSSGSLRSPPSPAVQEKDLGPWRSVGDTIERLEVLASAIVAGGTEPPGPASAAVLDWITSKLAPALDSCGDAELAGLLRGLDGRFVPPGPSGAPSRGRPEVLPTGRNFYSLDTRSVPTPAAWQLGWKSAQLLIERHVQEHGAYPATVALSAWGTANMRTGGDDIAQGLALMGAKPVWEPATGRVTGFEILPSGLLDRPRVDVTLRVSGFFRDAFPNLIDLFDSAARAVAALDEPEAINPLAARVQAEAARLAATGIERGEAEKRAGYRVFGSRPGAYGAGLQALIDEGGWASRGDLAEAYLAWGGWAYGDGAEGAAAEDRLRERLSQVEAVLHNQDNREHDLLDSDDYYQFEGGLAASVEHLKGSAPKTYHNDHSRPELPRIRTLEEEIARVVRGRAVNPKWLAGVMRHGYKGAFEMAATVDYLFAFAATADVVADHHFDAIFDAYLGDPAVLDFLDRHNPAARAEIAARLAEAIDRQLWRPRSNSARDRLAELMGLMEGTA
ncbi:MAG: cobaltochelatase subunit CobN [Aliidongia sp.]